MVGLGVWTRSALDGRGSYNILGRVKLCVTDIKDYLQNKMPKGPSSADTDAKTSALTLDFKQSKTQVDSIVLVETAKVLSLALQVIPGGVGIVMAKVMEYMNEVPLFVFSNEIE